MLRLFRELFSHQHRCLAIGDYILPISYLNFWSRFRGNVGAKWCCLICHTSVCGSCVCKCLVTIVSGVGRGGGRQVRDLKEGR